jgi:hypothetical protein
MGVSEVTLECPYCSWTFGAAPPDRLHSAFSLEKPLQGSFHGDIVQQDFVCRNPKCKKQLKVYWYAPLTYFDRV